MAISFTPLHPLIAAECSGVDIGEPLSAEATAAIDTMTAGKSFADFDSDLVLRSAVERQFEILGEALNRLDRLDPTLGAKIPDLRQIVAFRNILIHGYAVIDRVRV